MARGLTATNAPLKELVGAGNADVTFDNCLSDSVVQHVRCSIEGKKSAVRRYAPQLY